MVPVVSIIRQNLERCSSSLCIFGTPWAQAGFEFCGRIETYSSWDSLIIMFQKGSQTENVAWSLVRMVWDPS